MVHIITDRDSGTILGVSQSSKGVRDLFFTLMERTTKTTGIKAEELWDREIPVITRIEPETLSGQRVVISVDVLRDWLRGKI